MSTSIDDLLGSAEEPARDAERPSGGRARMLLRTAAITAAVVVVIVVGLRAVGLRVPIWIIVAGVLAVLAVRRVTAALSPPPPPRAGVRSSAGGEEPGTWNWSARDALRTAINGWERPLDWCSDNRERFTERVLPRLGELADERLRQRHGVTRESDPARARALLGEPLWTFLGTPARRPPTPRDLAAIVAELEKL
ncbi:hypothetical protein O7602_24235 [Micromonospora sp. WMMD1128]|uniref:hypothetical protein n=1 Tax=unclassified Micromonospora TaxID=2617518 RepID=UPI00248C9253|nr:MULTISPECIES: hypothetical protein [unclassified Micromonospora]WBB72779.1 hypothetical protein O7602_24235 [Micromonospora sp. WMMD1128]WFE33773.1 hypothetical protein O7613_30430 [Micromonospora sp. WMMD975]